MQAILLILILFSFSQCFSQLDFAVIKPDTNLIYAGNADTKFYFIKDDTLLFTNKEDVKRFTDSTHSLSPFRLEQIDFTKKTLLLLPVHGVDCHSTFRIYPKLDSAAKTFTVNVDVIYGGCRAGGHYYSRWYLIPRLPEEFKIDFVSRIVDERRY